MVRDYEIYEAKQRWTGDADTFNQIMSEKYGISTSRVKNGISVIKRILRLKQELRISENISYHTQEEVYQKIFTEYQMLLTENPSYTKTSCMEILAEKYNFSFYNIYRIIRIMTTEDPIDYFKSKRRLTQEETYNRDRAMFIEFLKWPGERKDFCHYAAKKYGITYHYATTIIRYCLYAVPERYYML